MLIHTRRKALTQGPIPLTLHCIDLIRCLVLYVTTTLDHFPAVALYMRSKDIRCRLF